MNGEIPKLKNDLKVVSKQTNKMIKMGQKLISFFIINEMAVILKMKTWIKNLNFCSDEYQVVWKNTNPKSGYSLASIFLKK